jgi:nicotinamide-nucleotide amidase
MGESLVEEQVKDLMQSDNPTVAPYAKLSEVHLRVTARAVSDDDAEKLIAPRVQALRERLGAAIFGYDDQTLEKVVVGLLQKARKHIAAAESCSGGLISKRITDVPDSSQVFDLGIVAYSNESKERYLRVPRGILEKYGAVSAETARAMAHGVRIEANADIGVGVTGIAGPGGGTPEKPVGTVYVAIAWNNGSASVAAAQHYLFLGRRSDIAYRSSQMALALAYQLLTDPDCDALNTAINM